VSSKDDDMTRGFVNVDEMNDPRWFIEFLDKRKTIEGEREVKNLTLSLLDLKPGLEVLDVGCGTGDDAREIASLVGSTGRVAGIDPSSLMIAESRKRAESSGLPVEFMIGDVRRLNFPDGSFDRVRTDRVLIFVPDIEVAIAEIIRILRPGGRVVASELDHELLFLDSRFLELNRRVLAAFTRSNPQPCLGRQLHRLFAEHGLRNIKSVPRVIRPPYDFVRLAFGGLLREAIKRDEFVETEIKAWLDDLKTLQEAGLFNAGTIAFTASGDKS